MLRCTVEEMDRGGHDRSLDSTDSFAAGYGGNRITAIHMLFRPQVCVIDHARAGPDHLA
jgi:hypothetical protein